MSTQITTAFVEQYKANVYHLLQQKGSKLRKCCRVESVTGKSAFYEQLGAATATVRSSRHSNTPQTDTPHSRRRVTLVDYEVGDLIDDQDQIRMLIDPTSMYAEAQAMALGRSLDAAIITAATAAASTGVDGSTSTAYDTNMTVDVQVVWPGVTAADTGLNVAKLITAKERLGANNVDPDEEAYLILNARQISSLLKDTHISSADYNIVRPLVEGKVAMFMGFTMIPTQLIGVDSNSDDKVLYWAKGGMLVGMGKDINSRIGERADKSYATQVYSTASFGATRMEEARVGYIECDPSAGPGA
jgi:hypothetical protein